MKGTAMSSAMPLPAKVDLRGTGSGSKSLLNLLLSPKLEFQL